jgi:hypothetical protein
MFVCVLVLALISIGFMGGCSSSSNNNTTVTPPPTPTLTLTAPNGGENWFVGRTANIGWTSTDLTGNVKIEFTENYGTAAWQTLVGSIPLTAQSYIWSIAGTKTSSARVRITSVEQPTVGDTSNANFSLVACPTACANAALIAVSEAVTLCTLDSSGADTINWFVMDLSASPYRFQLNGFAAGQDLDLYVKVGCEDTVLFVSYNGLDYRNATEDTVWTMPHAGQYSVSVRRPSDVGLTHNHGPYTLIVSPAPALATLPEGPHNSAIRTSKTPAAR